MSAVLRRSRVHSSGLAAAGLCGKSVAVDCGRLPCEAAQHGRISEARNAGSEGSWSEKGTAWRFFSAQRALLGLCLHQERGVIYDSGLKF
jgi:hypothetical protein